MQDDYKHKAISLLKAASSPCGLSEYPDDFWADREDERSILTELHKRGYIEGNYATLYGRNYLGELTARKKTWLKKNWHPIATLIVGGIAIFWPVLAQQIF